MIPHHHGGEALLDRKANKNAAGLEVLAAPIPLKVDLFVHVRIRHVALSTRRAKTNRGDNTCQYRLSAGQVVADWGMVRTGPRISGARPLGSSLDLADVGGLETLGTASDVGLDAGRQRKTPRGWIARGVSFGLCCITDVASVVFDPPGHGL